MSAAAIEPEAPEIDTLEDLHQRLGEVPLSRIRWRPYPGTAREGDVLAALKGPRKRICELVDGVLGQAPSSRACVISSFLETWV